jgi:hypothetical protein
MDKKQKNEIERAINFVEELSWLIESKKNMRLKEVPDLLRTLLEQNDDNISKELPLNFSSENNNIRYLIGMLPELFLDNNLFPTNKDIISFSEEVLKINITRKEKRTKYELIGLIVCETSKLNDMELQGLVCALQLIINDNEKMNFIKQNIKHDGFSWNKAIQYITGV